jgi:hypothetical protein
LAVFFDDEWWNFGRFFDDEWWNFGRFFDDGWWSFGRFDAREDAEAEDSEFRGNGVAAARQGDAGGAAFRALLPEWLFCLFFSQAFVGTFLESCSSVRPCCKKQKKMCLCVCVCVCVCVKVLFAISVSDVISAKHKWSNLENTYNCKK